MEALNYKDGSVTDSEAFLDFINLVEKFRGKLSYSWQHKESKIQSQNHSVKRLILF